MFYSNSRKVFHYILTDDGANVANPGSMPTDFYQFCMKFV